MRCLVVFALFLGCHPRSTAQAASASNAAPLADLLARYKSLPKYADSGVVTTTYLAPGESSADAVSFEISFERPNRIHFEYGADDFRSGGRIVGNGAAVFSDFWVGDDVTRRRAESIDDAVCEHGGVSAGVSFVVWQLLAGESSWPNATSLEPIQPSTRIGARVCAGYRFKSSGDEREIWVDEDTHLLCRVVERDFLQSDAGPFHTETIITFIGRTNHPTTPSDFNPAHDWRVSRD